MSSHEQNNKFETFIYKILENRFKKFLVIFLVALSFFGSIMMIPNKTAKLPALHISL